MHRLAWTILGGLLAAAPLAAQQPAPVDSTYDESMVSVRPERISSPPAVYPDSLRQAGISGRVVVRVIIDTLGRAERESTRVVSSTTTGLTRQLWPSFSGPDTLRAASPTDRSALE